MRMAFNGVIPMPSRRSSAFIGLLTLLSLTTSCNVSVPTVGQDNFLSTLTSFALSPEIPCDLLTRSFGLGHVPTVSDPSGIGIPFDEFTVTSSSGESLRVWYVPSEFDRGTIIFSMGAVADISCYLFITYNLWFNGWSMVLYDFEGFGGSSGETDITTLQADLESVLDWTREHTGREQVTLYGVSVGTIPTVAIANIHRDQINGVILDSSIDIPTELERFQPLLNGPPEDFIPLIEDRLQLRITLAELTQPTLAFTYGLDEYLTSSVLLDLLGETQADVTVAEFPELGHARGPYLGTAAYFYRVEEFLSAVWNGDFEVESSSP
jgi:pimeloyl-ACP methyl ester carboxylesterase